MTDSERITEVKNFSGLSFNKLAKEVGLKSVQTLYDIRDGKHGISKDVAEKIQARYLNINTAWLLTGEGEMLNSSVIQNNQNGDNINGHSVKVDKTETASFIELLKKKDEQIDRLLTIIENMNK